jgi:hypothetical protein
LFRYFTLILFLGKEMGHIGSLLGKNMVGIWVSPLESLLFVLRTASP